MKRIAAGGPVPSPKAKLEPAAVLTRRFPVRINRPNAARSNRSIGRLLPRRPASPVPQQASAVVGCQQVAPRSDRDRLPLSDTRIKTKSLGRGNGLSCKRLGGEIEASGPGRSHPLFAQNSKQKVASRTVLTQNSYQHTMTHS